MVKKITKPILYVLAWTSFALGFIGAFLPVLPTTPFMILAAYLFSKSSPRMHSWLTSLPYFGDAIIDWETSKVIRPKAKVMAITMIWIMMGATIIFAAISDGLKIMLAVIGVCVSTYILTRKSYASSTEINHSTKLTEH